MGGNAGRRGPAALALMSGPLRLLRMGRGAEFDLIRSALEQDARIRAATSGATEVSDTDVVVGPGSDCAVVSGGTIALTVDASIEDVHFRRGWLEPGQIGYRAVAAALSDLAAAAARPIGVLATIAVAPADGRELALAVMAGISRAAAASGAVLLGGDVSASPGPLIVDIAAVGSVDWAASRAGAEPGDEVWVTGSLGGAATAVRAWESGTVPSPESVRAFASPVPRIAEARWLAARGLMTACVDLSDGLAGDAGHLAAASGVRILIEYAKVPLHPAVLAAATEEEERLALALGGGEDYELCFTAHAGEMQSVVPQFEREFGLHVTRVGRVAAGSDVAGMRKDGSEESLAVRGFSHFRSPGSRREGREGTLDGGSKPS